MKNNTLWFRYKQPTGVQLYLIQAESKPGISPILNFLIPRNYLIFASFHFIKTANEKN